MLSGGVNGYLVSDLLILCYVCEEFESFPGGTPVMSKRIVLMSLALVLLIGAFVMTPGVAAETPQPTWATAALTLAGKDARQSGYAFGLLPSPAGDYPRAMFDPALAALPAMVDLSEGLPPVGAQGPQNSCVAWAVGYYLRSYQEGRENRRLPRNADEIFSPAYIYNQRSTHDPTRDTGMPVVDALRISTAQGNATLATMPYDAGDCATPPSSAARAEAALYRSHSFLNLFLGQGSARLELLKQRLAQGEPIVLAVPVYEELLLVNMRNTVVDVPVAGSRLYGGHALLVVGYDEGTRRFKFVNSWGAGWGERGFAYLSYDFMQQRAWEGWVLRDSDTTPPRLSAAAVELQGAPNNVPQTQVSRPFLAWPPSAEAVTYQVYWGTDSAGTSPLTTTQASLAPAAVTTTAPHYLRVRAFDGAGNATPWRTLFSFIYQPR
jgi:hypothetical protein